MCNAWCISFAERLVPFLPAHTSILEVGSRIVNGSVRPVLEPRSARYIGVDLEGGPGVDTRLDVAHLTSRFPDEGFDAVVTTEMLEHCFAWRDALHQMFRVLAPGGHFLLTTRSPGFALHGYPEDHWRFTRSDIEAIFAGAGDVLVVEDDLTLRWPCGVGAIVRRTAGRADLDRWRVALDAVEAYRVDPALDREGVHRPECAARVG